MAILKFLINAGATLLWISLLRKTMMAEKMAETRGERSAWLVAKLSQLAIVLILVAQAFEGFVEYVSK